MKGFKNLSIVVGILFLIVFLIILLISVTHNDKFYTVQDSMVSSTKTTNQTLDNLTIKISNFKEIETGYQVYISIENTGLTTKYVDIQLEDNLGNKYSEDAEGRFYLNYLGLFRNFIEPSSTNEGYLIFPKTKTSPKQLIIKSDGVEEHFKL